jgi:hypothetical protein
MKTSPQTPNGGLEGSGAFTSDVVDVANNGENNASSLLHGWGSGGKPKTQNAVCTGAKYSWFYLSPGGFWLLFATWFPESIATIYGKIQYHKLAMEL